MSLQHYNPIPPGFRDEIHLLHLSLPTHPNPPEQPSFPDDYEPELADLLRVVECPICRSVPCPPLFNCENGHFTCSSCRPKLTSNRCAYCQAQFTTMRNFPLENLVMAEVLPCDFRSVGCKARNMQMAGYEEHMSNCWFRSLAIPSNRYKDSENEFQCPRCNFRNSKRKLKCQSCQINLRVPTPMSSRRGVIPSDKCFDMESL